MNITFGICSEYENQNRLQQMISSIDALHIPHYEIFVLSSIKNFLNSQHIYSNGPLYQHGLDNDPWLPEKKNYIANHAHFDVLCLAHDYFLFDPDWYAAYLQFGTDWDVCSNQQLLFTGTRHFTDWCTWDHPVYERYYSLPYNDWRHTRFQYISGGYFLVKRDFMRQYPMNESLRPGAPEDVDWSLSMRHFAKIVCNERAIVRHNKIHRDAGKTGFPFVQEWKL